MNSLQFFDATGTAIAAPFFRVFTQVGAASYSTGGDPVDLSAIFTNSLIFVAITRLYVTATGIADTRIGQIVETGTNTYANRKFQIKIVKALTPAGTNAAPTASGICIATCTNNHPGLSAVAFTGTTPTVAVQEIGAGVNLSTITYEFLCLGT